MGSVARRLRLVTVLGVALAARPRPGACDPRTREPNQSPGSSIVAAGQAFEIGRPVVLWSDPQGFDGYETHCIDQSGGCCDRANPRFGVRKGLKQRTLDDLKGVVSQFVLHFDGCVNSRSCFKSMHNRERKPGEKGCGLSAHFMIDSDGTVYQTLDLLERAYHAEEVNSTSIGVEICNRGRVDPSEWGRLPPEYQSRPTRDVVINGEHHLAYEFRPEQYDSIIALSRVLLRIFPGIKPAFPAGPDGQVISATLSDPLSFAGILGHYHVDLQRQKWDPGALDFRRILRALNGFSFPVQVRSFTELPQNEPGLLAARVAGFYNAEARATGFFPLASARLWHSGVHLRAAPGSPVRAPVRGRIVAARSARAGTSSRSFVLIRHDVDLDGVPIRFFSLLAHLALDDEASGAGRGGGSEGGGGEPIPWLRELTRDSRAQRAALDAGDVVLLDERVEAGDPVGHVGVVSRGPEQGPEVHFEIFAPDRMPGELGRTFRFLNASSDGPIVRRRDLVAAVDGNGDGELDAGEVQRFFRGGALDRRLALRSVAVRHRHEWGDRTTAADFVAARELGALSEGDRRRLYEIAIAPYVFWTDDLARTVGLPTNQVVYSYNPITFLLALAARSAHVDLPVARGREIGDAGLEPRLLARVPLTDWTSPTAAPIERPLFGPPVGMRLGPRRRDEIPLIELGPTDSR